MEPVERELTPESPDPTGYSVPSLQSIALEYEQLCTWSVGWSRTATCGWVTERPTVRRLHREVRRVITHMKIRPYTSADDRHGPTDRGAYHVNTILRHALLPERTVLIRQTVDRRIVPHDCSDVKRPSSRYRSPCTALTEACSRLRTRSRPTVCSGSVGTGCRESFGVSAKPRPSSTAGTHTRRWPFSLPLAPVNESSGRQ